ncbi:glycerol kinase GlpK [Histidinibacterium aquaticum]|uniref:Glycerol kinase n=1 Tax=Histidinibacterium aquaticum TaxID=2613962 RepID=A0A5J5GL87_9RHOB|nr:glycerol kinase GlpK [Histidinibacterium aquaticum]KAA9009096.1 glycerol kinase GlpK [Histidinibacterium aquaticum]
MTYILAIDQGTTSSRAILFDEEMRPAHSAQEEFPQYFPRSGWVEHDAGEIWESVLSTCRAVMEKAGATASDIAAIGITNQRETVVAWDPETGEPAGRAIVWQDRRTAAFCRELTDEGFEAELTKRTGLLSDPYFSGTKLKWLLDEREGAREAAREGRLIFGTVDSWLIWKLTGGKRHVTDATNAARTLLYNIREGQWDETILQRFDIPAEMLPEVLDCNAEFGTTEPDLLGGEIPIRGVAGDQQAATLGQACFEPGMFKSTYGTGCFALLNTGSELVESRNRLLGTIAYQLDGEVTYAIEGAIFVAGAVVQWLRDGLGLIESAGQSAELAEKADDGQELILVPAFTGLGAPYWDAEARGAVFGLTRSSGPAEFARAALESVGFQTRDLLEAMRDDWPDAGEATLRVDGGMSASDWAMQFLADITGAPADRPEVLETTALGAAWLAGHAAGVYPDRAGFAAKWAADRRFEPRMPEEERARRYAGWTDAVRRTLTS